MCAIWVVFGYTEDVGEKGAQSTQPVVMIPNFFLLRHRGPDGYRLQEVPGMPRTLIGHHSLLVRSEEGHFLMPFTLHRDNNAAILYNGMIYNNKQIGEEFGFDYETNMDCEGVLHLYNNHGIRETIDRLDGTFAMCVIDMRAQMFHIVRDGLGVAPLYKMTAGNRLLAVSSEAKGLMELDVGVKDDLEITVVPPGVIMSYHREEDGRFLLTEEISYYKLAQLPMYTLTQCDDTRTNDVDKLRTLMTSTAQKYVTWGRRTACLLSGGLSSSILAAILNKECRANGSGDSLSTFTIGLKDSLDMFYAKEVSEYIGAEHHEILITIENILAPIDDVIYHLESYDVHSVRSAMVLYALSRAVKLTYDVVMLSGDGLTTLNGSEDDVMSNNKLSELYLYQLPGLDKMAMAHSVMMSTPWFDRELVAFTWSALTNKPVKVNTSGIRQTGKPMTTVRTYTMNDSGLEETSPCKTGTTEKTIYVMNGSGLKQVTCPDKQPTRTFKSAEVVKLHVSAKSSTKTFVMTDSGLKSVDQEEEEEADVFKETVITEKVPSRRKELGTSAPVYKHQNGRLKKQEDTQNNMSVSGSKKGSSRKQKDAGVENNEKKEAETYILCKTKAEKLRGLIREAFEDTRIVPDAVFARKRQCIYEGILPENETWSSLTGKYFNSKVTRWQMMRASSRFPHNPPKTKEAYFYREIFEKHYPNQADWLPERSLNK